MAKTHPWILCACSLWLACAAPRIDVELEPWVEVRSAHFVVLSNVEKARVQRLVRDLELFRSLALQTMRIVEPREPVPTLIYALRDDRTFAPFSPGGSVAGYMMPRLEANYIMANLGVLAFNNVIFHEYVHLLLHNQAQLVFPAWFDEGFAEFLSTMSVQRDGVSFGQPPQGRSYWLEKEREYLPLERLFEARSTGEFEGEGVAMFYAQAWLATHFFLNAHLTSPDFENRSKQLFRYLTLLNDGNPTEAAFREAFGVDFATLEAQMRRYAELNRFAYQTAPRDEFRSDETTQVRSVPAWEASFRLAELLAQTGARPREARELYERSIAERSDQARAHAGLARLAATHDQARVRFDRALELDPGNALTHAWYGDYLRQAAIQSRDDASVRDPLLQRSRQLLLRAIELDPLLPLAHASYGATFLLGEGDPTPGIQALEESRRLQPSNTTSALQLGELYLRSGRPDAARPLLVKVMRFSHGGAELKQATALLERLGAVGARAD